jgi:hypothetical protein
MTAERYFKESMITRLLDEQANLKKYVEFRCVVGFNDYRIKNLSAEKKYFDWAKTRIETCQLQAETYYADLRKEKLC